jgi:hypothetical protein
MITMHEIQQRVPAGGVYNDRFWSFLNSCFFIISLRCTCNVRPNTLELTNDRLIMLNKGQTNKKRGREKNGMTDSATVMG